MPGIRDQRSKLDRVESISRALAGLTTRQGGGRARLDAAIKALAMGLDCPAAMVCLGVDGGPAETLVRRGRSGPLKTSSFQPPESLRDAFRRAAAGTRYFHEPVGPDGGLELPTALRSPRCRSLRAEIVLDDAGAPLACVLAFLEEECGEDRAEERNFFRLVAQLAGADYRRMRAEAARERSETEVRGLVDASTEGVVVHRSDQLLYANRSFVRMLGYGSVESVLALGSFALTCIPEDWEHLAAHSEACARGEPSSERLEYSGLDVEGGAVPLAMESQVVEWDGAPATMSRVTELPSDRQLQIARTIDPEIIDSANFAIVGRLFDGTIVTWNGAAERMFGYSAEEAIGQSIAMIFLPDEKQGWQTINEQLLQADGVASMDFQRRRKDGSTVSIRTTLTLARDAAGVPVGVSSINQDMSPVRRLEQALERNQTLLQRVQHMGSMGFWTWQVGSDGIKLSVQARRVLGMAPEDGSIASLEDYVDRFVHPHDRARVGEILRQLDASNSVISDTHRVVRWDGRARSVQLWGEANFDESGKALSMMGVVQDMTEVERVREALVASEARFRDFADVASDWIWETGQDGCFRYVSDRISAVTGFPASYYMGKSWADCMVQPAGVAQSVYESESAARNEFRDLTFRIETRDGREAWVAMSGKPRYEASLFFQGYRGAGSDVTARKRSEGELRRAAEAAEKANEIKSRFLAAASHDLRQPLHAMRLLVSSLTSSESATERGVITAEIARGLRSMTDILNSLLDVSELDAGRVKPEVKEFNLGQLFETLAVTASSRAAEKGLDFRCLPTSLRIRSDPGLLARVVENFLSNAIQHTQDGKVILGCRRRGDKLLIEVLDRGPGIPPDKHDAIFEEYLQLEESAGGERGLGLGLAIVQRFADLLQHRIELQSRVGRGSRFAVEVPLAIDSVAQRDRGDAAAIGPVDLRDSVVLLIENDERVREATRRLLQEGGAEVLAVNGVREATRRMARRNTPPDLIMTDLNLSGGVLGPDVVESIRSRFGYMVPAIILTGETRSARLEAAARSGLPLLRKPASPESIWRAISGLLQLGEAAE